VNSVENGFDTSHFLIDHITIARFMKSKFVVILPSLSYFKSQKRTLWMCKFIAVTKSGKPLPFKIGIENLESCVQMSWSRSHHRSTTLLVGLPVSFFIMAVRFNERKHGGFPWRFNGISFLFKSRITGSKQSSILLYTHCGFNFLVRTVFSDFLES